MRYLFILLILTACTKEAEWVYRQEPREEKKRATCVTVLTTSKPGCPTIVDSSQAYTIKYYQLEEVRKWEQDNTWERMDANGFNTVSVTICNL